MGSSFTIQKPFSSALVLFFCPENSTVTSSPGEAVPQTGRTASRWSTMPSAKRLIGLAPARIEAAVPRKKAAAKRVRRGGVFMRTSS